MASLAESSIASVPMSKVLLAHERMLQQEQSADHAQQPEAVDKTHASGVSASIIKHVDSAVAESANAYHTPNSSPHHPPARLSSSKSAPPAEMEALMHLSPSQEAFRSLTRASSFHGYPGGDTQPMESQVYRDFTASIAQMSTTTPKKPTLHVQISPEGDHTYRTVMPDNSPKTCVEGDTGYIDLGNVYMQSSPAAPSTSSHVDELLDNPQTQPHVDVGFARPAMPETPAIAGHKRNSDGEVVTSSSTVKKTPGFTQLFGVHTKDQILSATQLFDQTQAPSSPQPDAPRSDPVMTRPSPNIHNNTNMTSPTFTVSSPVYTTHSRPGTAGEPRANYTSMRESQERRAAKFREEMRLQRQFSDVDDIIDEDDDQDGSELRYAQQRRQREISDQVRSEWSKLRASSRPSSRPTSRQNSSPHRPMTIDLITPAPNKERVVDLDLLDAESFHSEDDVPVNEEQPADIQNSDDEYDELAQTVLRSQANNEDNIEEEEPAHEQDAIEKHPEMHNEQEAAGGSAEPDHALDMSRDQPIAMASQHSAIADSQPSCIEHSRSLLPQQPTAPSSIPSVIPGSQYATKSNQFQSHAAMVEETSSVKPHADPSTDVRLSHVPSSPPIQASALNHETSNVPEQEVVNRRFVPESDLPGSDSDHDGNSSPSHATGDIQHETNPLLYSTAWTHASASGLSPRRVDYAASPLKFFASQQSKVYSQSPRTAAGVRHFADIAAAGSPPQGSGETTIDVDAIMSDVVSADDQSFVELVSTSSEERHSKRRRINHQDLDGPPTANADNKSEVQLLQADNQVVQAPESDGPEDAMAKTAIVDRALRDSPSKANELRSTTPPVDGEDTSTPESVKKRENAGATAASQLLSNRRTKSKPTVQYGKRNNRQATARKQSSTLEDTRTPEKKKILPRKSSGRNANVTKEGQGLGITVHEEEEVDAISDNQAGQDTNALLTERTIATVDLSEAGSRALNRVFALFKGTPSGYYPATYLGTSSDGSAYSVRFDDGTVASLEPQHVCRLELLVGDLVRVDLEGMRKQTWEITGLGAVAQNNSRHDVDTDIYGRKTVIINVKTNRNSDANGKTAGGNVKDSSIEVAVGAIYLTRTMWQHFENRTFTLTTSSANSTSKAETPSGEYPAAAVFSASKSGRTLIPTARASGARTSHLREESVSVPELPTSLGLFSGMAFAISYGSNEGEKVEVTQLIRSNGGIILEDGFDCLFDLPNLDGSAPTSPAKKSPRKTVDPGKDSVGLQLKPEYSSLGFVALIADRHSRRAKYVQALALSLPCLSGKWVSDSLNPSKHTSKEAPLPWTKYLLPAGESSYLGGAIRSRTMLQYNAVDARLSKTMEERDILLNGDGVLIVASKKGKSTWERRKPYAFLTLALGAAYVKRVSDLAEAKAFTGNEPEKWKWIYVDGSVADASSVVFENGGVAGKKRKRRDDAVKVDEKAMWASDGKLRIVNDEFVVQSLILGALVD